MNKQLAIRLTGIGLAALLVSSVATAQAGPFQFYSITPCRIIDTRQLPGPQGGPSLTTHSSRDFPVAGICGIPADAMAAVLNVVAVAPTGGGHLTIWPVATTMPVVATLNFDAGEPAIANGAIVPLGDDGMGHSISIYLGAVGTSDVVVDTTGYFK